MDALTNLLDGDEREPMELHDGGSTTRAALRANARLLAEVLRTRGIEQRAVGVLMPNVPEAIAAWFGIWETGGPFVPMNPRATGAELERIVATVGAAAVVTLPEVEVARSIEGDVVEAGPYRVVFTAPVDAPAVAEGAAIVQFTSGTTGRPKAVVLRHDTIRDLIDSVIGSLRGDRRTDRARMPNLVPMSLSLWAGIYQVLFAFRLGVPVVLMDHFDPVEFARLVAAYEIRSSVLPPAALVMLMSAPGVETLAPLRYVRCVSAPLSPAHARRFHDRFGIAVLNGYGQTELGGEAVGWTAADWKTHGTEKLGSVGRPHAAFELRVRADDGTLADPGGIGELEIRSSAALPPADAAMEGRITDDGWLRTGDLARIDTDGFVWIEGRVSAMINRGGLKVFPDEVEERIRGHAAVVDVAVAGVPDPRLGEVPWAFVVAAPGAGVAFTLDALQSWCREMLAPYKVPVGMTFVDALPRNEMGKVLRQELVGSGRPPA